MDFPFDNEFSALKVWKQLSLLDHRKWVRGLACETIVESGTEIDCSCLPSQLSRNNF